MKKTIILISAIILLSCEKESKKNVPVVPAKKCTVKYNITIIKHLKEHQEVSTSYKYRYDVWNGKLKLQPNVESEMEYFAIYTDGTKKKCSFDEYVLLAEGDTINEPYFDCFKP